MYTAPERLGPTIPEQIIAKYRDRVLTAVANLPADEFESDRSLKSGLVDEVFGNVRLTGRYSRFYTFGPDNEASLHFQFRGSDTSLLQEHLTSLLTQAWTANGDTISVELTGASGEDIPALVKLHQETLSVAIDAFHSGLARAGGELWEIADAAYKRRISVMNAFDKLRIQQHPSLWDGVNG